MGAQSCWEKMDNYYIFDDKGKVKTYGDKGKYEGTVMVYNNQWII